MKTRCLDIKAEKSKIFIEQAQTKQKKPFYNRQIF